MISKGSGVILNVNSGAGKAGFSNLSAYCAGKFGLVGLDFSYYQKKSKMLKSHHVAVKIAQMIFDANTYKNGESVQM
jgi:3-oxoacyl-[acyl-carrier protein] reductase